MSFTLQNIGQASPQQIADAILNGEFTFNDAKDTGKFRFDKQEEVWAIVGPTLKARELYERIKRCEDVDEAMVLCSDYQSQYPKGEHYADIILIEEQLRDKKAFELARRDRGNRQAQIVALENYIRNYPSGRYVGMARETIEMYHNEVRMEKERMIERMRNGTISKKEVLDMLNSGRLQENDLVPHYISKAGLDFFKYGGRNVDLGINDNLGPIRADSTDVYFIGVPNSGKSCLLAGLLLYAQRYYRPTLTIEASNMAGFKYAQGLLQAAQKGLVPGSTEQDERSINYIATKLQDEKFMDYEHPINFIEMSGEHIVRTYENYDGTFNSIPFHQYLRSDNEKYFFIVVDYLSAVNGSDQNIYLDTIIQFFQQFEKHSKVLQRTKAINLVLTKSDLLDGGSNDQQMAIDFINQEGGPYHNLYSQLERLYERHPHMGGGKRSKWSLRSKKSTKKPKIYPYSLGEFELFDVSFKYTPEPSKDLFWDILKRTAAVKIK
jgi:hypothetical protein